MGKHPILMRKNIKKVKSKRRQKNIKPDGKRIHSFSVLATIYWFNMSSMLLEEGACFSSWQQQVTVL
jgi:hypothetical protein